MVYKDLFIMSTTDNEFLVGGELGGVDLTSLLVGFYGISRKQIPGANFSILATTDDAFPVWGYGHRPYPIRMRVFNSADLGSIF